jgi:hypothetical protein
MKLDKETLDRVSYHVNELAERRDNAGEMCQLSEDFMTDVLTVIEVLRQEEVVPSEY